jgi:hypothetical protein
MPTPDDLTPDAFARLTALEQSQELLRRAQFLDMASRGRHAATLEYHEEWLVQHQASLDAHEAMLARHTQTMADLAALQTKLDARQDDLAAHQQAHAQHMARLDQMVAHAQHTLDAVLDMLRNRNGHGGHTP